jgi:hypothetical protein
MTRFVWCRKEERRIPAYRCITCRENCYQDILEDEEVRKTLDHLIESGKLKEIFVVKRKDETASPAQGPQAAGREAGRGREKGASESGEEKLFFIEDDRLKPFSPEEFTSSPLYRVAESFEVERRLVAPEQSSKVVYEGRKPSKKTIPIIVSKDDRLTLLDSWDELEDRADQLADAREVLGVSPVKQVFVLKRK